MNLLSKGIRVAKRDGLREFSHKTKDYVLTEAKKIYWKFSSTAKIQINGLTAYFDTSGRAPHSLIVFERGEREMLSDILEEVDSQDVFWDVGANIGYYSCFVGQKADTVVAFEPSPLVADQLRQNLEKNQIDTEVCGIALSGSEGIDTFEPERVARAERGSVEVERKMPDELIGELSLPDVIKMDIEGGEVEAVEGMKDILSSKECCLFYCEIHTEEISEYNESLESFKEKIRGFGFSSKTISQDRGLIKFEKDF